MIARSSGGAGTAPTRSTRQRAAVLEALDGCDDFVSAQELHHRMRRAGHAAGLTTVYRHLHRLTEAGDVDVVVSATEGSLYRACGRNSHHHHLVCRRCGLTVEIAGPEVETWAERIGETHAFSDLEHQVEVFGVCADCAATAAPAR